MCCDNVSRIDISPKPAVAWCAVAKERAALNHYLIVSHTYGIIYSQFSNPLYFTQELLFPTCILLIAIEKSVRAPGKAFEWYVCVCMYINITGLWNAARGDERGGGGIRNGTGDPLPQKMAYQPIYYAVCWKTIRGLSRVSRRRKEKENKEETLNCMPSTETR